MEQEIAQLRPDRPQLPFTQRVVQLERFLHQVRPQGFAGLRPVPRAPGAEVADHGHRASKR